MGRAHKTKSSPSKKAGANVSIILGHFQKCLTATILNILVDAKTEEKINEKIEKGRVRVSRVGSDVY